jgi:hypothetical protein
LSSSNTNFGLRVLAQPSQHGACTLIRLPTS